MTVRALDNVIFCMDKAYYVATFLVIDNLAIDYLIGWAFMLQYDVQLKPMRSKYAIGLPSNQIMRPDTHDPNMTYQLLDLSFKTKKMTLVVAPYCARILQDFFYDLRLFILIMDMFFECIFNDRTYEHRVPDGLIDFDEITDLMRSCKVDSAILPFSLQLRNSTVFEGDPIEAPLSSTLAAMHEIEPDDTLLDSCPLSVK